MASFFLLQDMLIMIKYGNKHGNAGVKSYKHGKDCILVEFDGKYYLYSYKTPGQEFVDEMKEMATNGSGLSRFITRIVKKKFEKMCESLEDMEDYLKERLITA